MLETTLDHPLGNEALVRPLGPRARSLHARMGRMRTRPSIGDYSYFTTRTNLAVLRSLLADLGEAPDVVDAGCGRKPFRPLFPRRARYLGLDFAASADADIVHDLGRPWPLAEASADVVLLSEVLEHLRDPDFALGQAVRVLRPGGRLFVTAPFAFPIHSRPYDFQRFTEYYYRDVPRRQPLILERLEPSNGVLTTPLLTAELLLLALPGVPFALKRGAWAAVNALCLGIESVLGPRADKGDPLSAFLRSHPMGYAALYRRR